MSGKPTAIIDIGSNSVRLVVYSGSRRVPYPVFNEKLLAGLGRGLAETGSIDRAAGEKALRALRRFKMLIDRLGSAQTKVVATAAVRDSDNGAEFVHEVKRIGLPCRVLAAEEEAVLAGLGVLSGIPAADGIVGDLGGGSLELVEVSNGRTSLPLSMPIGVLRVTRSGKSAEQELRQSIRNSPLAKLGRGRALYLVGGSWRALAKLDMIDSGYPLPIIQQYTIDPARLGRLRVLARSPSPQVAPLIAGARLATAPAAAMVLECLAGELQPSALVVSSFGIREGLLYSTLRPHEQRRDPLVEAARELSDAVTGTKGHGDALHRWLEDAFADPPELQRIRHAACLLMDAARRAASPFRADRTVEMALHGAWVGVSAAGRVLMAQALSTAFGRNCLPDAALARLANPDDLKRATQWGLAMRAGERLSAGIAAVLRETKLKASNTKLELRAQGKVQDLVSDAVVRRAAKLASSLDLKLDVVLT